MISQNATRVLWAIEQNIGYYPTGWVPMGAIRDTAAFVSDGTYTGKELFRIALTELVAKGKVAAIPEENQKTITQAQLIQGCLIGGERKDYATIC